MSKLLKSYRDFTGGLNTDAAPDNLLDNELVRADNVDLSERGGAKKRNGEERLNATSYNFPVEQLIEWPRDDGREILLAVVGTDLGYNNLCLVDETDYSLTVLCSVGTTDKVSTFYLRDKLYINDGTKYWVYDGEKIAEIFQSDPPSTLAIDEYKPSKTLTLTFSDEVPDGSSGAANFKPGVNRVMITFIDENNNESSAVAIAERNIGKYYYTLTIDGVPIGPDGTKKRNIYRNSNDNMYCVGSIDNNTETSYIDNTWSVHRKSRYVPPLIGGTYKCAYTFVSAGGFESEPSPVEEVKISEENGIKWTLEAGPEGITRKRLYRTEANGEVLRLIDEVDNSVVEYHDYVKEPKNEEDARRAILDKIKKDYMGVKIPQKIPDPRDAMTANNNLDEVRKCKYSCYHPKSMRCFFTGNPDDPSAVYYSEFADPTKVLNTSIVYPTTGDGPATGICIFGDSVLVHYENNSIWKWAGIDPEDDVTWTEVPAGASAISTNTINLTPNSLSFLSQGAWTAMNPVILHYSTGMQPGEEVVRNLAKKKVEKIIRNIADPKKAVSIFDAKRQRSLLAYTGEGAVRNNYILVYDWSLGAFTRYTDIQANDLLYRLNGDILVATNGYILRLTDGYLQADGSPVKLDILTKQYNLDYPYHKKRITRLFMTLWNPEEAESEVTVRVFVDGFLESEIIETTLYDSFVWGDEWGTRWGSKSLITTRTKVSASGHRVQVEFINEEYDALGNPEDVECIIYGLAFEFRPSRAKGTRL